MRNASWIVRLSRASTPAFAQQKTIEAGLHEMVTKSSMGPANAARICLDAKDIVKGPSPEGGKNCKRERSVVAGGKNDFATTCPDTTRTMTGTDTPTSDVIDGTVVVKGNDDDDPMTMESHITAKRVAETCNAG
jgi:hypothetical protein